MRTPAEFETLSMMELGMDGSVLRHNAISDNMANANTPGYKRKEVTFQAHLESAYLEGEPTLRLYQAHARHIDRSPSVRVQPAVRIADGTSMRNDDNNVDPERQMAKLAKNSLYFSGLAQFTRSQFTLLKQTINNLR